MDTTIEELGDRLVQPISRKIMFLAVMPPPPTFDAVVVKVPDGDTLNLVIPGEIEEIKVRLACIDAPERSQPRGRDSGNSLAAIVPIGTIVQIEPVAPNDRYGRTIAFVRRGEVNVNLQQVIDGQAWFDPTYTRICPQYAPALKEAEAEARFDGTGLWGEPDPCAPWLFRSNKCTQLLDCKPIETTEQ